MKIKRLFLAVGFAVLTMSASTSLAAYSYDSMNEGTAFEFSTKAETDVASVYENYPDLAVGFELSESYTFEGVAYDLLAEQLAGKTVRRQIIRDDKLYVLALDAENEPYIYLADLVASTVTELDKSVVVLGAKGQLKISDIAFTADNYLVACGMSEVDYYPEGTVHIFKWVNNAETGLPETSSYWFTADYSANFTLGVLGQTMSYSGTVNNGKLTMSCKHGTRTEDIITRFSRYTITDGVVSATEFLDTWAEATEGTVNPYFHAEKMSDCDRYEMMVSPLGDDRMVIDGNLTTPVEFYFEQTGSENPPTAERNETIMTATVNGANYFKYAGHSIMVAPKANAEGLIEGVQMFDVTNGFAAATEIAVTGATIEPVAYTCASAHGEVALTVDAESGETTAANIELFLVVDGKVTKFAIEEEEIVEPPVEVEPVYENYPDLAEGFELLESYSFEGAAYDLLAEQLAGKTVRRQIIRDDKLYVLALDSENEPYIYLADLAASTVDALDTEAVELSANGILKLSDIALTADNVLVASGMSLNHNTDDIASTDGVARGTTNFYKWSQDAETNLPNTCELWFTTQTACLMYRNVVGKTIAYSGTIENGTLTTSGYNGSSSSSIGMRFNQFAIVEGQMVGETLLDSWDDVPNETYFYPDNVSSNPDNWDFEIMVSPLGNNNNFVLDGDLIAPFEWSTDGNGSTSYGPIAALIGRNESVSNVKANGANYFRYAGHALMVTPKVNAEGLVEGIQIFDVTDGFAAAKEISFGGVAVDPVAYTYASAHGEVALTVDEESGDVTAADIELFLAVDGKVYKFTKGITSGIENIKVEETVAPVYYNLQGVKVANPANGIYIVKRGAKVAKEYVK